MAKLPTPSHKTDNIGIPSHDDMKVCVVGTACSWHMKKLTIRSPCPQEKEVNEGMDIWFVLHAEIIDNAVPDLVDARCAKPFSH